MASDRNIIEGVPRVAFAPMHDGQFEFTPFPSCVKSVVSHLGTPESYHYLLSTSGGAFRLLWHAQRWEGGNVDMALVTDNPVEPFCRCLAAAGYEHRIILNSEWAHEDRLFWTAARRQHLESLMERDRALFKDEITRSIDNGVPVIAFGVVGPPEACIVAGYDNAGDVLLGWSLFQEHMDDIGDGGMAAPSGVEAPGYFRQDDWFAHLKGIIVLGDRTEPDLARIYAETLEWIPTLIEGGKVHEFYSGQAAYDAYIDRMLDDAEFDGVGEEALKTRKMVHFDAMTMISERAGGARFLRDIAAHPDFGAVTSELTRAADAFEGTANEMHGWWAVAGEIWDDEAAQVRATADPDIRRAFVPYIRQSRDKDQEGAAHVSRALSLIGCPGGIHES